MNYTMIDLNEWSRGNLFQFYIDNMRIVMSLTVDIDVANLKLYSKKTGIPFYPLMLWVVSKVINNHDEFKYSWDNKGNLIRWDYVSPSYTDFHSDDENFTKLVTEYTDDLHEFYGRVMADRERHKNDRAVLDNQPLNFFDVSCLPWVRYKHFDVHVFDEGTVLTDAILSQVKSGDIIKIDQTEMIVNNKPLSNPRKITGHCIASVTASALSIYSIDWSYGEELEEVLTIYNISASE